MRAIQSDVDTYREDPEDEEFLEWKLGFEMEEGEKEKVLGENHTVEEIYRKLVPGVTDEDMFWCRYFFKVNKLKQAEAARVTIVKKAMSVEDEELPWDLDEDEEEESETKYGRDSSVLNVSQSEKNEDLLRKEIDEDVHIHDSEPSTGKSKKSSKRKREEKHKNKFRKTKPLPLDVYHIPSEDENCCQGMKKWVSDYYQSRPGLDILQKRIDDFITKHEEEQEQKRIEEEEEINKGGWTVVTQQKGRKKTTDADSGVSVGAVSETAVLDKMAKKKSMDVGVHFYRFQRREAQRSEVMKLQTRLEEDKRRIQQLRASRKFRPC